MRFLIKVAFFLLLVFVVVAYFAPSNQNSHSNGEDYSIFDGVFAFKSALNDMGGFCDRNPETCVTGKSFFVGLKDKALEGARISYEFLYEKLGGQTTDNMGNH